MVRKMVDHQGMVGGGGARRFLFIAKAEEILRYINDIMPEFTIEEKRILDKAAQVIASHIQAKMNDQLEKAKELGILFDEEIPFRSPGT